MPKISVVMPAYNAEKYIGEAIESILNQTFKDFEFIIINDGSVDHTKEIIQKYNDSRIVLLENDKNRGIVLSLNKGLDAATGEYIARMDADDIALMNRLERQAEYLDEHKDIGVLGTGICTFGEKIKEQKRVFTTNAEQLKAELLFNSCIAHPTVMIRKSVLQKYNLKYNTEFAGAEDYCLWWNIAKVSKIATLPDILLDYRIHESQITKKKDIQYYNMMDNLMEIRFKDIGYIGTKEEKEMFMKYCLGEYESYSEDGLKTFVDCLDHIRKFNEKNTYFNQKKLVKIFELAIIYALNNSVLKNDARKSIYQYAVKAGMFTWCTRIKVKYHRMY